MSGRGGWSGLKGGGGGIAQSKNIYNSMLQQGLNSNIKGIRAKAEQGTGNYSFKDATAVSFAEANTLGAAIKPHTRGEYTLVEGYLPNGKHVYFAGKTESPQIQALLNKRKSKVDTTPSDNRVTGATTTYDRAISKKRTTFDSDYFRSSGKPDWFISHDEVRKAKRKKTK